MALVGCLVMTFIGSTKRQGRYAKAARFAFGKIWISFAIEFHKVLPESETAKHLREQMKK